MLTRAIEAISEDLGDKDPEEGGPGLQIYEIPASGSWRSSTTTLVDFHRRLSRAIEGSGLFVEAFQGMDGVGKDPIGSDVFVEHLRHLRNQSDHDVVWVAPFADVIKYMHERAAVEVEYLRVHSEGTLSDEEDEIGASTKNGKGEGVTILRAQVGIRKAFVLERLKKEIPRLSLVPLTFSVSRKSSTNRGAGRGGEEREDGGEEFEECRGPMRVWVDGQPVPTKEGMRVVEGKGKGRNKRKWTFEVMPSLTEVRNIEIRC